MKTILSTLTCAAAAIALCCVLGTAANAQGRGNVAICPAVFDNNTGTPAAKAEAIKATRVALEQAGFSVVDYDSGKTTWSGLNIAIPTAGHVPAASDLTRFGQAVHARYVLVPEFDFNAKRTWGTSGKFTTVKAAMSIYNVPDGSLNYTHTETITRSAMAPGDFASLSRSDREQRVVDEAVNTSLASFTRLMKLILH